MKQIFLVLMMLYCAILSAQSVVSGTVRNSSDKTPIPKCAIVLLGSDGSLVQTKTDSLGTYHLKLNTNTDYKVYTSTDKHTTTPSAKLGFLATDDYLTIQTTDTNKIFTKDFELNKIWECEPMIPALIFEKNTINLITKYGQLDEYIDSSYFEPQNSIKKLYNILITNPTIIIQLSGHCSANEKDAKNLSLKRAELIKQKLVELGINEKRIVCEGYGSKKLKIQDYIIAKEKSIEGKEALHSINRRCVFKIISWEFDDGTPKKAITPQIKIKVFGSVTSSKDNSPVPNCTVVLKMDNNDSLIKKTDSIGYYSFDFVNPKFKQGKLSLIDTEKARTKTAFDGFFNSEDIGTFTLASPLVSMNYMKDFMLTPMIIERVPPKILFKKQSVEFNTEISNNNKTTDSTFNTESNIISHFLRILNNEPNLIIEIDGHCSANEKRVDELSLKRAEKIKEGLVKGGINEKRILCKGYGDSKLKITETEIQNSRSKKEKESLHAENRRCTIKIISWDFKE